MPKKPDLLGPGEVPLPRKLVTSPLFCRQDQFEGVASAWDETTYALSPKPGAECLD